LRFFDEGGTTSVPGGIPLASFESSVESAQLLMNKSLTFQSAQFLQMNGFCQYLPHCQQQIY
jgi:hypothetical protein